MGGAAVPHYLLGPLISALVHTPTDGSFRFDVLGSTHGMNRLSVFRQSTGLALRSATHLLDDWTSVT